MKYFAWIAVLLLCACVHGLPVKTTRLASEPGVISADRSAPSEEITFKPVDESLVHIHAGINRPDSPHPMKKDAMNWKYTPVVETRPHRQSWPLTGPGVPPRYPETSLAQPQPIIKRPDTPDPRHPEALNWDILRQMHNHQNELEAELKNKPAHLMNRPRAHSMSTLPPLYPMASGKHILSKRHEKEAPRDIIRDASAILRELDPEEELRQAYMRPTPATTRRNFMNNNWNQFMMDQPLFPQTPEENNRQVDNRHWFPELPRETIATGLNFPPLPTSDPTRPRRQRTQAVAGLPLSELPDFNRMRLWDEQH